MKKILLVIRVAFILTSLFILSNNSIAQGAISYVDIAELVPTGTPYLDSTTRGTAVKENYAYALTREGNLYTFYISDIFNLLSFETYVPIGSPLVIGKGGGLVTYQDYLYVYGSGFGITVVNVQNPASPTIVSSVNTISQVYNMIRFGDYLIACEDNYVESFSLTTPSVPLKEGELFIGTEGWASTIYGNYLYVTGGFTNPTLYVIGFFNPTNLSLLNSISLNDIPYHIKVVDSKLITSCTNAAQLWSLSDPLSPSELDSTPVSGRVCALDNYNLIFNGVVLSVDNSQFSMIQTFDPQGIQADGYPYGSDVTYKEDQSFIFLAQDRRVLALRSEETRCDCDVSGDGTITPQDALCAFQKYLGICPTVCGDCEDICCDVNGDGQCTPADALCIFQEYLGIGWEYCN